MRIRLGSIGAGLLLVAAACADISAPPDGPAFTRLRILDGGGFDDAGNVGTLSGSQWSPSGWHFLPGSGNARSLTVFTDLGEIPDPCISDGLCQHGDLRLVWGALAAPPFEDQVPDPDGNPSLSFGVMTNGNFVAIETTETNEPIHIVTVESGIRRQFSLPALAPGSGIEFQIDAAFGTGQKDNGPAHDDFAVVEFVTGTETAPVVTEILRWSRNELQPGGQGDPSLRHKLDCGEQLFGQTYAYPLCTGWERNVVRIDEFAGQSVEVRIRIRKADPIDFEQDEASFLAIDNVAFFQFDDEIEIEIDIMPGSSDNPINIGRQGMLPIAVFGSSAIDVRDIDVASIRIGDTEVARRKPGGAFASYSDVNGDGIEDLMLHFEVMELVTAGALGPETSSLELVGQLTDGTRVFGSDAVTVVP